MTSPLTIRLVVNDSLRPFLDDAIERLNYLYPQFNFRIWDDGVEITGGADEAVIRDVHYILHRAKIFRDGAALRDMLHRAVLT